MERTDHGALEATQGNGPVSEGMLSPYRVLDLTEGGCLVGGKTLGDMGADVLKIERPGGSPSRSIGPFWHGQVHSERSLFWMAYAANKRGLTLNLETADGRALFSRLAQTADFLLESFPPGYLDSLGVGYEALRRSNPKLIWAAITPFGQDGPKARDAWSDFTVWASGGLLHLTGQPDRPPVAISFMHQTTLNAGAEAAAAAMIAHYYRQRTGEGQFIDVSMQEVAYWTVTSWQEFWEVEQTVPRRLGSASRVGFSGVRTPRQPGQSAGPLYPTKDGFITFSILAGPAGGRSTKQVVSWMREEGMAPDWLVEIDWGRRFDMAAIDPARADAIEECFVRYFLTKTKAELSERALRAGVMIGPVFSPADIGSHPHFKERGFFPAVPNDVVGEPVVHCGPPLKASLTPLNIRRRAPMIGEHNEEVYCGELGLSRTDLEALRAAGVI